MTFPESAGDAWVWWLVGPSSAVGVVQDDLSKPNVRRVAIALPPFSQSPDMTHGPAGCPVPANVTESELANNPEVFNEDPGAFCKPFQKPEHILSERRFSVIIRAEQPAIGSEGSVISSQFSMLEMGPDAVRPILPDVQVSRPFRQRIAAWIDGRTAPTAATQIATAAKSRIDAIVSNNRLPDSYADKLKRTDQGRTQLDGQTPARWEDDVSRYQASTIARGHILEYAIRWRSNGYSLGTVASTLTLAPRQIKRIQKVEWERLERARRQERTELIDEVEDGVVRERDYEDEVRASLSEWARGESSSSMSGGAAGFGFVIPGVGVGGGGAAHSRATSNSSQWGGRRATAAEEQRLRDTTRRYADSLRRLESTVVTEVSQQETVIGTTEIVRNYNYAHS